MNFIKKGKDIDKVFFSYNKLLAKSLFLFSENLEESLVI